MTLIKLRLKMEEIINKVATSTLEVLTLKIIILGIRTQIDISQWLVKVSFERKDFREHLKTMIGPNTRPLCGYQLQH
jgi:hypothetical protein